MTITFTTDQTTTGDAAITPGSAVFSGRLAVGVPQMLPEDELLFWTTAWRERESRSLAELDQGTSHKFENFRELALWLLRAED